MAPNNWLRLIEALPAALYQIESLPKCLFAFVCPRRYLSAICFSSNVPGLVDSESDYAGGVCLGKCCTAIRKCMHILSTGAPCIFTLGGTCRIRSSHFVRPGQVKLKVKKKKKKKRHALGKVGEVHLFVLHQLEVFLHYLISAHGKSLNCLEKGVVNGVSDMDSKKGNSVWSQVIGQDKRNNMRRLVLSHEPPQRCSRCVHCRHSFPGQNIDRKECTNKV